MSYTSAGKQAQQTDHINHEAHCGRHSDPDATPTFPCVACGKITPFLCDHCQRPICHDHSHNPPRMHWRTYYMPGYEGGSSWKSYDTEGTWRVCSACAEAILERNKREIAIDQRTKRVHLIVGITICTLLIAYALAIAVQEQLQMTGALH